ncbi:unnamed protein product [Schistosoma mattheei]|uniref:Uncharacterized protein n=1 Tax=Schistosoma mattheei TaxID=31246 RepID=A0A3P8KM23_9TREM|nr:unnamed protein product [Schistosoma mattheei]
MIPRIYGACQHVLKEEINMKPEFLSPTLVQRAAIHQLMSMVCIPIQFKGAHLKPLIPLMSNDDNPCSLNDIKNMMVNILCDTLSSTEDPVNFQLLLSEYYLFVISNKIPLSSLMLLFNVCLIFISLLEMIIII